MRDVLVICNASVGMPAAAELSVSLAQDNGCHVTACCLVPKVVKAVAAAIMDAPPDMAPDDTDRDHAQKEIREKANRIQQAFDALNKRYPVPVEWHEEEGLLDEIASRAAVLARYHDLVLVDGPTHETRAEWEDVIERLVCETGRPCIVVPRDHGAAPVGAHVQIAWDGSKSAARAVHDALPFMRDADLVSIVVVLDGKQSEQTATEGQQLREHLRLHGVESEVHNLTLDRSSISDKLAEHAAETGCDMMVMGAFEQSWLRELVFGSVTRDTVQDPRLPVLLSH